MIKPVLQDHAFLTDVKDARSDNAFFLWWLGQSGFLIRWRDQFLLLDPYLSDSLTKKYATTDKPHVRMTERVVAPEKLDFLHVITSSHNHTDHLDAETLLPLLAANPSVALLVPEANREFVANRLKCPLEFPIGVDAGQSITTNGFTIHGVPAAHEKIDRDEAGRCQYMGYVIQFGPWTIYHSGDTILYDEMVETLSNWPIDLALLPINGAAPERRVAGNLDGREAATLAHNITARMVIPCHFEMFEFNTASPDEFVATCKKLGQSHRVLRAGERWSSGEL
ncbi:MAG TPA: MBL fold metallo-hydrolase [Verrucomicrobiae bacterium]|nr:MBL fold metallo-hydrolase [Verrucomicrobiae bacterium]